MSSALRQHHACHDSHHYDHGLLSIGNCKLQVKSSFYIIESFWKPRCPRSSCWHQARAFLLSHQKVKGESETEEALPPLPGPMGRESERSSAWPIIEGRTGNSTGSPAHRGILDGPFFYFKGIPPKAPDEFVPCLERFRLDKQQGKKQASGALGTSRTKKFCMWDPFICSLAYTSAYHLYLDEVEAAVVWMLRIFQRYQRSDSPTSCGNLDEKDGSPEEERLNTLKLADDDPSWRNLRKRKVTELVNLLILKYKMKEPVKEVEMLGIVTEDYKKQFPVILREALKCLEMIFGIVIKENDPVNSSFVLTNALNLTYNDNSQRLPRNGFLLLILGVIFVEGNCASEESVWEFLNVMGIYDGKEHFIYGEPREFLTRDLVQQNYLKYRQVPESCPARYMFLWGPRAYSETTKMQVLGFLAKFTGRDPISFSFLYREALRDEEERAQGRKGPTD